MRIGGGIARYGRTFGWGDLLVVAATAIWAVNVVVVKLALRDSGPLTYSAIRYLIGGAVLLGLAGLLEGKPPRPRRSDLWLVLAAAVTGVLINQASFTVALSLTNADNVAMVSGLTPLLVVGWVAMRGSQRFGAKVWTGLALGMVGLVLVVGSGSAEPSDWLGMLVALGNPVSWAAYLILLPRLLGRYGPLTLSAVITLLGALMLTPLGVADGLAHPPHPMVDWFGLLAYSALLALALTSWLYLVGIRHLGPARTSVYVYLQPFMSVLAAGLLIGERVLLLQLVGGAIMLAGVILSRSSARSGPIPASATSPGSPHLLGSPLRHTARR